MINATIINLQSWRDAERSLRSPTSMPCLCLSHHQRRLESCDINGWVRCQKCRGYVSRPMRGVW